MIMEDIKRTISELEQESSLPAVGVELVDNELATLYMNSKKSEVNSYTLFIVHNMHKDICGFGLLDLYSRCGFVSVD